MKQDPQRVVSLLLIMIVLSMGYLDYWSYSQAYYSEPGIWMDVVSGTARAPNQYRVGVIDTAYFLSRVSHLGMRHTFALLDVMAGLVAVFALFLVLRRSAVYRSATVTAQWFGAAAFVVLIQYYLGWLLWYQRPETLPTTATLSLTLLLLSPKPSSADAAGRTRVVGGLLLLAVAQAFIRADVAFALHLGILLVCLTSLGDHFVLTRRLQIATSLVALLIIGGIQYALMWKIFPHANYGDTPVLQLFLNLRPQPGWVPFVLFVVPFGWTASMMSRLSRSDGAASGFCVAAVIFMGMWLVVGRIREVRIFLPFALALAPLTVELAMLRFLGARSPDRSNIESRLDA
jgi:hypothetical protein